MKRFFSLLCVVFMAVAASAQITWSVKGGLGFANCSGDEMDMESRLVGRIGVGIEKPLTPEWSIMPSLEFAMKGAKYSESESDPNLNGYSIDQELSLYYIQIPVLAAYRLNLTDSWNMTLKAGPYLAYGVGGTIKESYKDYTIDDVEKDEEDIFNYCERLDFGLDIAVDLEYHRYVFGLEYEFGLTSITKEGGEIKNGAFYITAGYKF